MAKREKKDVNVDFLYKTMLERDPSKRRVKIVPEHLMQVDFAGLEDSSSDSDFQVGADDDESNDDDFIGESDVDEEEEEEEEEEDGDDDNSSQASSSANNSAAGKVLKDETVDSAAVQDVTDGNNAAPADSKVVASHLLVCCVCLRDDSTEDDEIIVCDSCAASVHEGCYGVSDTLSFNSSSLSLASTEPWFCDACRAGATPLCELCPNSGGIYKETDVGRWVHLVCALYVPGVAFSDPEQLKGVTLFEMPYTKWGAKRCSLCEDERFSWTGVCISCDAGMCRATFHVTCAQKNGLLSEADDEDMADPMFAYCRQHVDKELRRSRRRNWMALQPFVRARQEESKLAGSDVQNRIQRKLSQHICAYQQAKASQPAPWVRLERVPRLIETCPSALARLLKKAELMEASSVPDIISKAEIRKKWHLHPALTAEFACYYYDRNERIANMRRRRGELALESRGLEKEEQLIKSKHSQLKASVEEMKAKHSALLKTVQHIYKLLSEAGGKKITLPDKLHKRLVAKVTVSSDDTSLAGTSAGGPCGVCHKSDDQHLLVQCDVCHAYYHLGCLDPPLTRMPKKTRLQGWQCSRCTPQSSDSDNPTTDLGDYRKLRENIKQPVKYLPVLKKRNRGGAKESNGRSRSANKDSDRVKAIKKATQTLTKQAASKHKSESALVSPDTSRSEGGDVIRRGDRQRKRKRSFDNSFSSPETKSTSRGDDANMPDSPADGDTASVVSVKSSKASSSGSKSAKMQSKTDVTVQHIKTPRPSLPEYKCEKCSQAATIRNAMKCDTCQHWYHSYCLSPPQKVPRMKGYVWHCDACCPDSDSDDDSSPEN